MRLQVLVYQFQGKPEPHRHQSDTEKHPRVSR